MHKLFRAQLARFLAAPIIGLSLAATAQAQALWNNTRFGMSVDDVKRVTPMVLVPETPNDAASGDIEKLRIEDVEIAGRSFQASYLFNNDKLTAVRLTLQNPGTEIAETNTFNALENALRSKYGKEMDKKVERGLFAGSRTTWISGSTDITLMSVALGQSSLLMVTYKASVAADASKL